MIAGRAIFGPFLLLPLEYQYLENEKEIIYLIYSSQQFNLKNCSDYFKPVVKNKRLNTLLQTKIIIALKG